MDSETLLPPVVYPLSWNTIVDWIRSFHLRIRVGKMTYSGGKHNCAFILRKSRSWVIFLLFILSLIASGLLAYYFGDVPIQHLLNKDANSVEDHKAFALQFQLPPTVVPLHYDIRLSPSFDPANFTTSGDVLIDIHCLQETDRVVLHGVNITIDPKSVKVNSSFDKWNVIT